MNIHKNARLTPLRREEMAVAVLGGRLTKAQAARLYGVSLKIVSRWTERFRISGRAAMTDRSSRPTRSPRQMGQDIVERILHLRRQRLTGKHIAMETGVSPATVSRILRRAKLSRMKDIDPVEPVIRYEYAEPGGLIHLDIKRLGRFERVGHRITGDRTRQSNARGVGWEYVHVCIDDVSRIAFTDIFPDEKPSCHSRSQSCRRLLCKPWRHRHAGDDGQRGLLYPPRPARRSISSTFEPSPIRQNQRQGRALHSDRITGWAYARAYPSSQIRKAHLPNWTHMYNWHRPHSGLKSKHQSVASASTETTC